MVAFVGPRHSQVDIAQAVGRAMRTAPGKKLGYIVVPLFVDEDQQDEQFAIQEEGFDDVADVLNAMLDHDEELVDIIRNLREQKGEGKPFNLKRLRKKLQLTGPFINLDALMNSISVKIVDRIGSSWDEWFGVLMKFKAREGPKQAREPRQAVFAGRATQSTVNADRFDQRAFRSQVSSTAAASWNARSALPCLFSTVSPTPWPWV
jgi:superfamily II DNA or RNA helicase